MAQSRTLTSDEVMIVEAEERIGGSKKLWMEDDLDAVVARVEELTAAQRAHDGVDAVVHNVVRRDGRQVGAGLREDAALQAHHVVLRQQVGGVGNATPQTSLVHALTNVLLNLVYRILQALLSQRDQL